jgi:hypothetical protein
LKKAISDHLEAINEQFSTILSHERNIPQIEMDITLEYLRKLYIYLKELDKENTLVKAKDMPEIREESAHASETGPQSQLDAKASGDSPEAPKEKKSTQEADLQADPDDSPQKPALSGDIQQDQKNDTEEKSVSQYIKEATPDPIVENQSKEDKLVTEIPEATDTPTNQASESTVSSSKDHPENGGAEKKPVIDLFTGGSKTLADKLKGGNGKRLADKIKEKQVESLKSAIGINDKFLFINELFKGKLSDYNQAIKKIDDCDSENECLELIDRMKDLYEWQEESDSFIRLKEFVEKKLQASL